MAVVRALLLCAPVATAGVATVAAVAVRPGVVGRVESTLPGTVVAVASAPSVAKCLGPPPGLLVTLYALNPIRATSATPAMIHKTMRSVSRIRSINRTLLSEWCRSPPTLTPHG